MTVMPNSGTSASRSSDVWMNGDEHDLRDRHENRAEQRKQRLVETFRAEAHGFETRLTARIELPAQQARAPPRHHERAEQNDATCQITSGSPKSRKSRAEQCARKRFSRVA